MQSSTSLTEGIKATLRCIVTSRPASTVIWQYNSAINATNSTTSITNGYLTTVTSLLFIYNPVQSMDGQQITCLAYHPFLSPVSKVTLIRIHSKFESLKALYFFVLAQGRKTSRDISTDFFPNPLLHIHLEFTATQYHSAKQCHSTLIVVLMSFGRK